MHMYIRPRTHKLPGEYIGPSFTTISPYGANTHMHTYKYLSTHIYIYIYTHTPGARGVHWAIVHDDLVIWRQRSCHTLPPH